MPLLVIAIVVQAVLVAFCVMAYRLTTGEEVAQENITVALLASPARGARSESSRTLRQLPKCTLRWRPMPTADAAQLDRAFHALADESRRAMVVRLSRGAASVSELAAPLDMSRPSVMQHLDVLQRSGVVRSEKVGRVRTCRLEPGPMRTLEQWIAEHRAIWERHFDRLSDVLDDAFPTDQGDRR
jgi:DNA-binding transcriptional ArsR family regulator